MDDLEKEVAQLEVATPRRSSRKRVYIEPPLSSPAKTAKRKNSPKPDASDAKVKKLYTNKTCARFARQALETIYEDPVSQKNGKIAFTGVPKIKRLIKMDRVSTPKHKKMERKKKIKRLGLSPKMKKISSEDFDKRLELIDKFINEEDEDELKVENGTNCEPMEVVEEL